MRFLGYSAVLAAVFLFVAPQAMAASAYRAYAEQVTQQPPAGISVRSDLEAVLDGLAQQARASTWFWGIS